MPSSELDERELYRIVRRATRDAIWDVIGTVLAVIAGVVVILAGSGFVARGLRAGAGPAGWLPIAFGLVLVAGGLVYVLREVDLLPFARGR